MNIFVLSESPLICAEWYVDKHIGKMLLETTQLLSNVRHIHGLPTPYKVTHFGNTCTLWASDSRENYIWLFWLGVALSNEFVHRFGKEHATSLVLKSFSEPPDALPAFWKMPRPLCMPDEYKSPDGDVIKSYRNYYLHGKKHLHKWTRREPPSWINAQSI